MTHKYVGPFEQVNPYGPGIIARPPCHRCGQPFEAAVHKSQKASK